MRPFMESDRVGLLPPGVGHKPAEPEAPAVTVESVLADIARLSIEDRMTVRLKLNMAAYGENVRMRDNFEFVAMPPAPVLATGIARGKTASEIIAEHSAALSGAQADFGKPMTGYIDPAIYGEAPGT